MFNEEPKFLLYRQHLNRIKQKSHKKARNTKAALVLLCLEKPPLNTSYENRSCSFSCENEKGQDPLSKDSIVTIPAEKVNGLWMLQHAPQAL